jgi:hypothetical protein
MPNFTYTNNIPAPSNSPSTDVPNMQVNTQSIASILGGDPTVDMIGFGNTNGGWHNWLTWIQQGADPGSVSGQYRAYTKSVSSSSEQFVQKDGISAPIQITRGVPSAVDGGYTYLPGGLLMQWKNVSIPSTSGTFTFSVPFTTSLLTVMLGPQQNINMYVSSSGLTSVTVSRSGSGASGCWVTVIGI